MGTGSTLIPSVDAAATIDLQRRELDWLLTSGVLGRSGNITRVLRYICEETFEGRAEQLTEYSIATVALGRRADFHPQTDTIVRVTFHSLRKRLNEVYGAERAGRPMRLVIPPGRYAPTFLDGEIGRHRARLPETQASSEVPALAPASITVDRVQEATIALSPEVPRAIVRSHPVRKTVLLWILAILVMIAGTVLLVARRPRAASNADVPLPSGPPARKEIIRAMMGPRRQPYLDHSGNLWSSDQYCQGGTDVAVPSQPIEGTADASLYLAGVRGIAHCIFPVRPGLHEIHFYFADTSNLAPATRLANISINAAPSFGFDVVDSAGGHSTATSLVVTGVAPENDGAIKIDFVSETSLLNAIEIVPSRSDALQPVRIVAGSASWVDSNHQVWSSDRYFSGGRHGQADQPVISTTEGMFAFQRVGRFHYSIPAVPLKHYRLNLYFREPWFGRENGAKGGPRSRVFDLSCNGTMLLKGFDILAADASGKVVKTFQHVQADATGRLDLYFMPVINYPVVSAIEVLPED